MKSSIILEHKTIKYEKHDFKPYHISSSKAYYRLGCSSWIKCSRCNLDIPYGYDQHEEHNRGCFISKNKYLYPPHYPWEHVSICSSYTMNRAIQETADKMYSFIKRHQKHNLPEGFISGSSSVSSQALELLYNQDKIINTKGIVSIKNI